MRTILTLFAALVISTSAFASSPQTQVTAEDPKPIASRVTNVQPGEDYTTKPEGVEIENEDRPASSGTIGVYRVHATEEHGSAISLVFRPGSKGKAKKLRALDVAGFLPGSEGEVEGTGGRVLAYPGSKVKVTNTAGPGGPPMTLEIQQPMGLPPVVVTVAPGSTVTYGD